MWDGGGANQNLWKQAIFVLHSITTGIPLFRAIFLSKLEIFLSKLDIFLSKLEMFISKLDIFLFETWYISFWNLKFWFCILSPFYFKQYLFSVWAKTWNAKQQSCQLSKNTDNIYGKRINMYWKYIHIYWKHIGTCNVIREIQN